MHPFIYSPKLFQIFLLSWDLRDSFLRYDSSRKVASIPIFFSFS